MNVQTHILSAANYATTVTPGRKAQHAAYAFAQAEQGAPASHHFGEFAVYPTPQLVIQPKLTVGPVNDQYEQEADRVAQRVVSQLHAPAVQRQSEPEDDEEQVQTRQVASSLQRQEKPEEDEENLLQTKPDSDILQREEESDEDDEQLLQTKPAAGMMQRQVETAEDDEDPLQMKAEIQRQADNDKAVTPALEASIRQRRGGGQPLPVGTRSPMEQAFGASFASVRVHTDAQADQLNRSIQARAFTTGQDIFMRRGEYRPDDRAGQELLAHELTHVVQQTAAPRKNEGEPLRRAMMAGHSRGWNVVQRSPVYRGGGATKANLTPRPDKDDDGISTQSSLQSANDVTKAFTNKLPNQVLKIETDNLRSPGKLADPANPGVQVDAPALIADENGTGKQKTGPHGKWMDHHVSIRPDGPVGNKWVKAWQQTRGNKLVTHPYTQILMDIAE